MPLYEQDTNGYSITSSIEADMKSTFRNGRMILQPESPDEAQQLTTWKQTATHQVLVLDSNSGTGVSLKQLGNQLDVCREPINVTSRHPDESIQLIANFADTPFILGGFEYQSVESFWQGLKAADPAERSRIAAFPGKRAKADRSIPEYSTTLQYEGATIIVGTWDHWKLMERACTAKFQQHHAARQALIKTGSRPLIHRVRNDSKVIPGVIMAEIWMKIRARCRLEAGYPDDC